MLSARTAAPLAETVSAGRSCLAFMLNMGVESFVWGTVCSGGLGQTGNTNLMVLSGQCKLAEGAVQCTARQEALNGLGDEAAHNALSLYVDRGLDPGEVVQRVDVVGDVHLDEGPDGGQPQGPVARLVDLDVEREFLAGEHARDASAAAGLEAIGLQTLDLKRDGGPSR